jgi:hypothetical protein
MGRGIRRVYRIPYYCSWVTNVVWPPSLRVGFTKSLQSLEALIYGYRIRCFHRRIYYCKLATKAAWYPYLSSWVVHQGYKRTRILGVAGLIAAHHFRFLPIRWLDTKSPHTALPLSNPSPSKPNLLLQNPLSSSPPTFPP